MDAEQYRRALHRLGLTVEYGFGGGLVGLDNKAAGKLLGVSERTSRRYASGTTTISYLVASKIRELLKAHADGRA
jgi:hypothetical protein